MPSHAIDSLREIEKARRALREELGREPTVHEIGARAELAPDKVEFLLRSAAAPSSLDMPLGDETPLGAILPLDAPGPEELTLARDLRLRVHRYLASLSPREQDVLRLRYGIDTDHEHTLEEISRLLSVSRERVRQIEVKALGKLRHRRLGVRHAS